MELSKKEVKYIASLSRLDLTENEINKFQGQLSDVLDYVSQINELDTKDIKDFTILESLNVIRQDIPKKQWKREDLLNNVPKQKDGYIVVPEIFKKKEY